MINRKLAGLVALGTAAAFAAPASAAVVITSVQIRSAANIPGGSPLQISEFRVFSRGINYALQSNRGVATGTSVYLNGGAGASTPDKANDGIVNGDFPNFYHSNDYDGNDVFTLTLSTARQAERLEIFGRNPSNCCNNRDVYTYTLLNGTTAVGTGTLDARNEETFASADLGAIPAVPEPATWGMMILGFGLVGGAMRRRKAAVTTRVGFA